MTYPGPHTRRNRLPNHTYEETLELEARQGIYVNALPSARANAQPVDGWSGSVLTPETTMRGWTAQQPWVHVDCPVMHRCIMCAVIVDPDELRDHARGCKVERELAVTH